MAMLPMDVKLGVLLSPMVRAPLVLLPLQPAVLLLRVLPTNFHVMIE